MSKQLASGQLFVFHLFVFAVSLLLMYFFFLFFILLLLCFCRVYSVRWRVRSAEERKLKQMEHILTDLTDYRTCTTTMDFLALCETHTQMPMTFFILILFRSRFPAVQADKRALSAREREKVKWIEFWINSWRVTATHSFNNNNTIFWALLFLFLFFLVVFFLPAFVCLKLNFLFGCACKNVVHNFVQWFVKNRSWMYRITFWSGIETLGSGTICAMVYVHSKHSRRIMHSNIQIYKSKVRFVHRTVAKSCSFQL